MKTIGFISLVFLCCVGGHAQFKNDHVFFKTIYIEELCHALQQMGDGLLLDVRSPGEFSDTSAYNSLNIGRVKGAINISSREIHKRLDEIRSYQNKPVFLICSHSQRSRIVAKMLVDSGFTNVTNINGGMTELNMIRNENSPCLNELYTTGNLFNLLSPAQTYKLVKNTKDLFILDVRPDSAFQGKTSSAMLKAHGRFKESINLPLLSLEANLDKIPRGKTLLIIDRFGDDSYEAAQILLKQGYTGIHILFNGLDAWISENEKDLKKRKKIWENGQAYGLLTSQDFHSRMKEGYQGLILDIRPYSDFTNQNKEQPFRNKGHIQGAINIPEKELTSRTSELMPFKKKEIIVYTFSGNPEAFAAAETLINQGFKKVKILTGGIYNLRWKAANVNGLKDMMKWVVDVPAENY